VHWDGRALTDLSAAVPPLPFQSMTSVAAIPGRQWFGGCAAIVTKAGEDWGSWSIAAPAKDPDACYFSVVAFSGQDVWAVVYGAGCGGRGPNYSCNFYSSVVHWDGTGWSISLDGPVVSENNRSLQTLIPAGPSLFAGGNQQFEHWDGTKWNHVPLPATAEIPRMWAASPNDVWLVIDTYVRSHWDTFVGGQLGHFDGNSITLESLPVSPSATAIAGSESRLWVAGRDGLIFSRPR
jgi:hypothetical protein